MKIRTWLAAVALAFILPAAARAQDRGSGYMGILFGREGENAARVERVVRGSPADRAGIRAGDVVVRLNGRAATEEAVDDLRERLERGDTVRLRVRRDGREEERLVVAAPRPRTVVYGGPGDEDTDFPGAVVIAPGDERVVIRMDTIAAHMDSLLTRMDSLRGRLRRRHGDSIVIRMDTVMRMWRDSLARALPRMGERMRGEMRMLPYMFEFGSRSIAGAEFAEMNAGLGRYFHTTQGLLVLQVAPQTPAARGGLQAGDVVVEANGRAVRDVGDLREAFVRRGEGQEVRLTVIRDGARRQLSVRWDPGEFRTFRVAPGRGLIEERVRERRP